MNNFQYALILVTLALINVNLGFIKNDLSYMRERSEQSLVVHLQSGTDETEVKE